MTKKKTETFDTKHAGNELRGLLNDVIAECTAMLGTKQGATGAALRMIGLDPYVATQFLYRGQEGISRKTLEKVCQKIGMSVEAFMADHSYSQPRSKRK